jgi:toxin-antitoxin system PIN domain toxin
MIIPDVNVLVGALQPDDPHHEQLVDWLGAALNGREKVGLSLSILSGVVRVLTNPHIFRNPPGSGLVVERLDDILGAPAATIVSPGQGNWRIFAELCRQAEATGNLVSDAFHAALAIEHQALFVTLDRDFAKFPGLRSASPLDP